MGTRITRAAATPSPNDLGSACIGTLNGDLLIAQQGQILATIKASGDITGNKVAALAALRGDRLHTAQRVAIMAALHHAVLLDERLAAESRPAPPPMQELHSLHRRGLRLDLHRSLEAPGSFAVFRDLPPPACRAADLASARRWALQAAQAFPGATFAACQLVEATRLEAMPAQEIAA